MRGNRHRISTFVRKPTDGDTFFYLFADPPRLGTSSAMTRPSRTSFRIAVDTFMGSGLMLAGPASEIFFSS